MPWKSRTKYVLVSCYPSLVLVRKERDPTPTPKKWAAFSFSVTCSRLSSLGRRQQHWCPPHHNHHLMHNWISGCVDGTTTMCVLHNDCRDAADRVSWLWAGSGMGEHSTYFWRQACSCNRSNESSLRGKGRKCVNILGECPPCVLRMKGIKVHKSTVVQCFKFSFWSFHASALDIPSCPFQADLSTISPSYKNVLQHQTRIKASFFLLILVAASLSPAPHKTRRVSKHLSLP